MADEGDPIDAPPGPYKLQPENQGRLLWLTGAPGSGKSTTAQLIGRMKGKIRIYFHDNWKILYCYIRICLL